MVVLTVAGGVVMLRAFVRVNRAIASSMTPTHFHETNVFSMFTKIVTLVIAQPQTQRVLDAGAGASWFLPDDYKRRFGLTLVGLDLDPDELALNRALDERVVCDVADMPIPSASIDAVTAYSGVEHFPDNEGFLRECFRVLRPGGRVVAQFPNRYAPFAILNRMLPEGLKRRLLHHLVPGSDGVLGFRAYYDRTNYSAFRRLAERTGFEVEYHHPGFFSSSYFGFFVPLYALSLALDLIRFSTGWKDAASYNLFVLVKPGAHEQIAYTPQHVRLTRTA